MDSLLVLSALTAGLALAVYYIVGLFGRKSHQGVVTSPDGAVAKESASLSSDGAAGGLTDTLSRGATRSTHGDDESNVATSTVSADQHPSTTTAAATPDDVAALHAGGRRQPDAAEMPTTDVDALRTELSAERQRRLAAEEWAAFLLTTLDSYVRAHDAHERLLMRRSVGGSESDEMTGAGRGSVPALRSLFDGAATAADTAAAGNGRVAGRVGRITAAAANEPRTACSDSTGDRRLDTKRKPARGDVQAAHARWLRRYHDEQAKATATSVVASSRTVETADDAQDWERTVAYNEKVVSQQISLAPAVVDKARSNGSTVARTRQKLLDRIQRANGNPETATDRTRNADSERPVWVSGRPGTQLTRNGARQREQPETVERPQEPEAISRMCSSSLSGQPAMSGSGSTPEAVSSQVQQRQQVDQLVAGVDAGGVLPIDKYLLHQKDRDDVADQEQKPGSCLGGPSVVRELSGAIRSGSDEKDGQLRPDTVTTRTDAAKPEMGGVDERVTADRKQGETKPINIENSPTQKQQQQPEIEQLSEILQTRAGREKEDEQEFGRTEETGHPKSRPNVDLQSQQPPEQHHLPADLDTHRRDQKEQEQELRQHGLPVVGEQPAVQLQQQEPSAESSQHPHIETAKSPDGGSTNVVHADPVSPRQLRPTGLDIVSTTSTDGVDPESVCSPVSSETTTDGGPTGPPAVEGGSRRSKSVDSIRTLSVGTVVDADGTRTTRGVQTFGCTDGCSVLSSGSSISSSSGGGNVTSSISSGIDADQSASTSTTSIIRTSGFLTNVAAARGRWERQRQRADSTGSCCASGSTFDRSGLLDDGQPQLLTSRSRRSLSASSVATPGRAVVVDEPGAGNAF